MKFALMAEHHPAFAKNFGTPNLIKTLCSIPAHPFRAVIATDLPGPKPVAGPWDALPTLSLFRPRSVLPKVGLGLLDIFFFRLQTQRVLNFLKAQRIDYLFALITNNPRFAIFLANLPCSIPKYIYLLDDFVKDSHIYRIKKETARQTMDQLMSHSERVFSISPVCAADLERQYKRSCEFLPIPIPNAQINDTSRLFPKNRSSQDSITIHHAGTIHHLYADAVAGFISLLNELVKQKRIKITLEIWGNTSLKNPEKVLTARLKEQHHDLTVKICGFADDLIKEQNRADFLLLVNSFSLELEQQARCSFSSKTTEYLVSGTPILLYAPPHSSLVTYLSQHQAAHIVCTEHPQEALPQIDQIISDPDPTKTVAAAQALARTHHSGERFISKITNYRD